MKDKIENWLYRRKVICINCLVKQDLEFKYGEEIESIKCPRCGCRTLEMEI